MSSDLQTAVAELQFSNYLSVVIAAAVTYDFIITFPKEIDYIWNRPWTSVSCMFVLVRYLGPTLAMIDAFFGSTLIPGPILDELSIKGTVIFLLRVWGFVVFLAATEIVMILRVYAMYSRSKIILGVLLVFYGITVVLYAISGGYYNNPNTYLTMTTVQVLDMSFCNPTYQGVTHELGQDKLIPRLTLAALLFILVVAQCCKQSYQNYKATKQWSANQYIQLLTKEGVLYFLGHLLYVLNFGSTMMGAIISTFTIIVMYIITPRFIVNVRELHLRDLYKWNEGIDSGFGLWKGDFAADPPPLSVDSTREGGMEIEEVASLDRDMNGPEEV